MAGVNGKKKHQTNKKLQKSAIMLVTSCLLSELVYDVTFICI